LIYPRGFAEKIAETIKPAFPDSDLELLVKVIQRFKDQDTWPQNPIMSEESFERLQDIIETAGELDQRAVYEDVINNKYAQQVIEE
jgi:NitT/TauT family transport system substrate-binding protein